MLTALRSLLVCHVQAAASSFNQLCRKPVSTALTVVVLAVALALPALLATLTENMILLTSGWKRSGHISLYLKPSLSLAEQKAFMDRLKSLSSVAQATLKSPDDGLNELTQQEGMKDVMRYLPENPLPAVVEVLPSLSTASPQRIEQLYNQLKADPDVDLAKLDLQWIQRLQAALIFFKSLSHALMLLLASAVVLVVGNTLRLAIYTRHEEIQVLKLIGATDPYILRPFLYSGIWYGFLAAVIAVFLVNIFILSLGAAANKLAFVYQMRYPFFGMSVRQILILVVSATILGWLGARLSVKRQLAFIEPYN